MDAGSIFVLETNDEGHRIIKHFVRRDLWFEVVEIS
jgi:hypothetical protein